MSYLKNKSHFITAIIAMLTMVLSAIMLFKYPSKAELSNGYKTPVLAFEFAQSPEDLKFMTGDSPDAVNNRIAMRLGQKYDTIFPFFYAGLIAMCILSISSKINILTILGILFSIFIIPSDLYENSIMNSIIDSLESGQSITAQLSALHIATWLKWGNIAIAMLILSIQSYLNKDWFPSILISGIASVMILTTWVTGAAIIAEIMMLSVSVFFIYFSVRSIVLFYRKFQSA
jgi:hypothetical protein